MQVIDHEPHAWFLLRDDAGYVLDVNCSQSFVGFSATLRLAPDEAARIEAQGRQAIDALARAIQQSHGRYANRCGDALLESAALAAINAWRAERS